ncbi:MAG: TIGR00730 family Rossman fold protein [Bacteriovoracaceae bacterium]|nr:TIGR00730 family Rossman fold protein [Bacteriovoracaceae bacterium]
MKEETETTTRPEDWGTSSRDQEERVFLEGPKSRTFEIHHVFNVAMEILKGLRKFHFIGPCVTVFGSARFLSDHEYYRLGYEVGRELALKGFAVMTGGGPGIMEAANKAAKDLGVCSLGCNITLPTEQKPNPYLDIWMEFKYFMVRKFMLAKYSYGFVALPGGFGTLDELFGILTLIQTKKIKNFPVVLVGKEYWEPLRVLIEERFVGAKTIHPEDTKTIYFTDSPRDAALFIQAIATDRFELRIRPHKFFGERRL